MAARKNDPATLSRPRKDRLDDFTRQRIQTTQIVKRLCNHILGTLELSNTQVRAAEILLRKTLPDLASVEHTGEAMALIVEIVRQSDQPAITHHSANVIEHQPHSNGNHKPLRFLPIDDDAT